MSARITIERAGCVSQTLTVDEGSSVFIGGDGTVGVDIGTSRSAFPLDAEQVIRGIGFLAAQWFDRTRRPNDGAIGASSMTLALADAMGVAVPVEADQHGTRRLLKYGQQSRAVERRDRSKRPVVEVSHHNTVGEDDSSTARRSAIGLSGGQSR